MSRKSVDRIVLAGFVILSVLLYVSTDSYTGIAQKTSAKYVRFLALSFGGLGLIQLAISLAKDRAGDALALTDHWPRFLGLIAALIAFAVSFETLGFFIPAAVFIPAVALLLGQRSPLLVLGTTVGILLAVYLIFVLVLGIRLPGPHF